MASLDAACPPPRYRRGVDLTGDARRTLERLSRCDWFRHRTDAVCYLIVLTVTPTALALTAFGLVGGHPLLALTSGLVALVSVTWTYTRAYDALRVLQRPDADAYDAAYLAPWWLHLGGGVAQALDLLTHDR